MNMKLPKGRYKFFFGVDNNADGIPNGTWLDTVKLTVE
jgi:hypothetical protein